MWRIRQRVQWHLKVNLTHKNDLGSICRRPNYVFARALYYGLCREMTNESLAVIGGSLGQDHATALNAINNIYNNFFLWGEAHYVRLANVIKEEFADFNHRPQMVEDLIKENVRLRRKIQELENAG